MMEDVGHGFKFALILVISCLIITVTIMVSMFVSGAAGNKDNTNQTDLYYSEDGEHFHPYNDDNKSEWYYVPPVMPIIIPHMIH